MMIAPYPIFWTRLQNSILANGSSPVVGSSNKRILAFETSDIAKHNFHLSPPESYPAGVLIY